MFAMFLELSAQVECSNTTVRWRSGFESDYKLISELSRGRFSVVHRCVHKQTSVTVAAKCVSKRLQDRESVETEYNTLNTLKHHSIYTASKLYETPQHYTIIMQM